jgi:ABC-type nitrate/sulfonate/bicarbonate transport systems, periplasmic components
MNASDQMALLLSGRADLNVYGDISFAGIVAADVPLTIVHGMQRPAKPCGIAVRKDSPITSITQLKGKILLIPQDFHLKLSQSVPLKNMVLISLKMRM